EQQVQAEFGKKAFSISAATGDGLAAVRSEIYQLATGGDTLMEGNIISNERQMDALRRAKSALADGVDGLRTGMDLDCAAIDLRTAWEALGEITGQTVSEDIIDRIFTKFCLGK
ncbi:MAG: tRNA uridine-5-carboxymethylaminomethyl(34) synthesis GTPase MnmE, partial [Christensenellaceae bacterium]|nr:tRNA uridine-5-carboxymethylaminomethyl(34) synthesis GTPase MnmE [Christensenellaceae bacterium]